MSTYDQLTDALDIVAEHMPVDLDLPIEDVSRLVEKLAQEHDDMLNERDSYAEDLDDLNKTARDAGYRDAAEALDVLSTAKEHNLRAVVEDHHDIAGHRGPVRFCSDRLCSSALVA